MMSSAVVRADPSLDPSPEAAASPEPAASPDPVPSNYRSTVAGKAKPPSRGGGDYQLEVGALGAVPRADAAAFMTLAPGILLTNEGGQAHAEQVFMRGFDAREGQDIEFSLDGVPINESGNLHGNGYSDLNFILPELVQSVRVVEGPYDPRQGNYAVAGSADFELGLASRGINAAFSYGSFNTKRLVLLWGPANTSNQTFVGAELYQTDGFGQNRDGQRGSLIAQWAAHSGALSYRITAQAYLASFHTAGVIRQDDYKSGVVGFYGTYDPLQGEDASRYSVSAQLESRHDALHISNQLYFIARPLRVRENFTGFLLDTQSPIQMPHGQRGDLIDLNNLAFTFGAHGAARYSKMVLNRLQEIEVGYFVRGDFVNSTQHRIDAATGHPYHTDADLQSTLGDIGLYADANLHPFPYVALRGGVRAELLTFDVLNKCAVQSVDNPSVSNPPGDASCLSQGNFGVYRDPQQRSSAFGAALLPRASLIVGPLWGVSLMASYGQGVRSTDPIYVTQDMHTPFASAQSVDAGGQFTRAFNVATFEVRASFFETRVNHDLIFSQIAGRNILGGASTRQGVAALVRLVGRFFDVAANLTYVRAYFNDTALLIPYIPAWVFRFDGALFGDIPIRRLRLHGRPFYASLAAGITYVAPRPLPQSQTGDPVFTIDTSLSIRWWFIELGLSVSNLLDSRTKLGQYDYVSDFHSRPLPTLVAEPEFSAGPPRTILGTLAVHFGGGR